MPESGIFKHAVKLPASDRPAFLDKACGSNAALRLEVEGLLRAHEQPGNFMDRPPIADATTTLGSGPERPGMRVGPYKLLQFLGEGGMGTVFLAEQTQPIRRMVALKIIKHGMDSTQVLARFEAERQALALMDHPNIAKVLDAGKTDGEHGSERPYFVMELVKGVPITEFCDKNKLGTRDRLELFIPVCNAIQHAHMKGIIHRDIKPSNVLIALYDGKPVPKVIDFGVAKAMAEPLTQRTLFTQVGQIVGTFEYMSPEQATLNQLDIDTRSDIYSLGVLLYELLTGVTPLDKTRLRSLALDQLLRAIREEEPMRPSVRLSSEAGARSVAGAYRGTESSKLAGLLRGELDWIVMKCLEKERNRRFVTAGSLAQDIERYLHDEPVQACPPSLGYRARKAFRKNKVAILTTSTIFAALLVGIALASWQAVQATRAERNTAAALDVADGERTRSNNLVKELDAKLGENKAANAQILREQAERRADQYAWDMQSLPAVWEAGNVAEARKMLERQPTELRNFEWHYWNAQTHAETAAFRLRDADDLVRARGVSDAGWAFSPDGSRVARVTTPISFQNRASGEHGSIKVWDVASRDVLITRPLAEDESIPLGFSWNLSLSRDGKVVLVSGTLVIDGRVDLSGNTTGLVRANNGWVRVLEVDSGKVLFDSRKEPGEGRVADTAFLSRDGRRLVTHECLDPETNRLISHCKVWDLTAAERKPVTITGANIVGFSPDGSRLVGTGTVHGERTRYIWDATTGVELLSFDSMRERTVVFSPKGTLLAGVVVGSERTENGGARPVGKLMVYDVNNGKEVVAYDLGPIPAVNGRLPRIHFTPDESQIACSLSTGQAGFETARTAWSVIDVASGKLLRTFDDPATGINFGFGQRTPQLLSDDGSQIIHATENVIHTMDRKTGLAVHTLRGCVTRPSDLVALPNGRLRTVEPGGTIRDWNLKPVEPLLTAVAEGRSDPKAGPIGDSPFEVSADGAWVARFRKNANDPVESLHVYDTAGKRSFELTLPPRDPQPPGSLPAGIVLLSADGKRAALFRGNAARGGPGGEEKVDPAGPPPDVTVWDVASQKVLFHSKLSQTEPGRLTALSPDGTILAFAGRPRDGEQRGSKLRLIDIAADGTAKTMDIPGGIGWASFSPDGTRIQCGMGTQSGAKIMIFDTATGNRVCTIEGESLAWFNQRDPGESPVLPKSWSPDGTRLAVAEVAAARIHLFDTATGKLVKALDAPNRGGSVRPNAVLAFSPDGRRIACEVRHRFGEAATVNVLNTESGKELLSLLLPTRSSIPSAQPLRFSPDGNRLLHFGPESTLSRETGTLVTKSFVRVTTWDATPLPEPKQP